jgi:hypothetical protein
MPTIRGRARFTGTAAQLPQTGSRRGSGRRHAGAGEPPAGRARARGVARGRSVVDGGAGVPALLRSGVGVRGERRCLSRRGAQLLVHAAWCVRANQSLRDAAKSSCALVRACSATTTSRGPPPGMPSMEPTLKFVGWWSHSIPSVRRSAQTISASDSVGTMVKWTSLDNGHSLRSRSWKPVLGAWMFSSRARCPSWLPNVCVTPSGAATNEPVGRRIHSSPARKSTSPSRT